MYRSHSFRDAARTSPVGGYSLKNMQSAETFIAAGKQFIVNSNDLRSSITSLVRFSASVSGSDMGSLYLLDATDRLLKPYILVNLPARYTEGCEAVALGTQCCGRAALHKRAWFVQDMWTDPLFIECRAAAIASGMRAAFSIPVLEPETGECLGTLASHFYEVHRPDQKTLEIFEMLADLIAFALKERGTARLTSVAS